MLRELQLRFLADLFSQDDAPPTADHLADNCRRTPVNQFASYRESVLAGMIDALAETYPVCKRLVGERFFNAMALRFIRRHPSQSPDLNEYGAEFGEFIHNFSPAESLPYLGDVARLERVWQRVFDGAEPTPGNLQQLDSVTEADTDVLRFKLRSNCYLLESDFPVHHIWQANQDDKEESVDASPIDLDSDGVRLFVWRQGLEMRIDMLTEAEWQFAQLLVCGTTFGEICINLHTACPHTDIGALLASFVRKGWITGFELKDRPTT